MMTNNNQKPLISVALITYNQEQYIAQAIDSILMQQIPFEFELVIGEDCSTDNTRQIVMDYKNRHPDKIQVIISDENVGMMSNLVRTIKACRGEYIAFCEGDDYWLSPDKLRKQLNFMRENPSIVLSFHKLLIKSYNKRVNNKIKHSHYRNKLISKRNTILSGGDLFNLSAVMLLKGIFLDWFDWLEKCPITDIPIALIAIEHGDIGYLNETLSVYRHMAKNSWSSQRADQKLDEKFAYLDELLKMRKDFDARTNHRYLKWIKRKNSSIVRRFVMNNNFSKSEKEALFNRLNMEMNKFDKFISQISISINYYKYRILLGKLLRIFSVEK